ncbi:hypothetical protein D3C71_2047550 [compost metagenome]
MWRLVAVPVPLFIIENIQRCRFWQRVASENIRQGTGTEYTAIATTETEEADP